LEAVATMCIQGCCCLGNNVIQCDVKCKSTPWLMTRVFKQIHMSRSCTHDQLPCLCFT
jgi:hypothetical protein